MKKTSGVITSTELASSAKQMNYRPWPKKVVHQLLAPAAQMLSLQVRNLESSK